MKKIIALMAAVFLLMTASNCIVTDKLFAPMGSKKGSEIKSNVQSAAMIGYLLGAQMYASQKNIQITDYSPSMRGAVVAGIVAQATSSVKDGTYYTASSADDCASGVQTMAMFIAYEQFNASTTVDASCWNGSSTDYVNCINQKYGTITGLTANGACAVKETGKIIHLNDTVKL